MMLLLRFIFCVFFIFSANKVRGREVDSRAIKARVSRDLLKAPGLDDKRRIVVDYFLCFEENLNFLRIKRCVNSLVSSSLSLSDRKNLQSLLLRAPLSLHSFQECSPAKRMELTYFEMKTSQYICSSLLQNGKELETVFFFKENGSDQVRLYSIY